MTTSEATTFGFPSALRDELDNLMPGNAGTCGFCGDTILGGRHRVIDGITERLLAGELETGADYGIDERYLWIIVAASYEHDKAIKRQRRADRRTVTANKQAVSPSTPANHALTDASGGT